MIPAGRSLLDRHRVDYYWRRAATHASAGGGRHLSTQEYPSLVSDLVQTTRARVRRIGRRLGALPATAAVILLTGPVWIGYNGLELVIAPLAMIAMQAVALHSLLRGYQHRAVASLIATVVTFPLALLAFSLLSASAGGESFDQIFDTADPWTVGAVVLAMTVLGGLILIGFPLGFGVGLGGIRRSTRWLLVAISALVVTAFFVLVAYDMQADPSSIEDELEAWMVQLTLAVVVVPLTALTSLGSLAGYRAGWLLADRVRPGFEALLHAARYLQPLLWPSVGFFLGYLAIAVVFAGYYATLGLLDEQAYQLEPEDATATMGDFLYFSLMTMLTLDNGKIEPLSRAAKVVVATQALIATGWMLIFFAAVTAYVQRFWSRIDHEEFEETTSSAGEAEERLVRLETLAAAEQERASVRHRELLEQLREIEARRAGPPGGG